MLKIKTFPIGPIETNCYIAYDDNTKEAILIDPAVFDKGVADFIAGNKIKIKFIINTHGHYDHIGGDKEFGYPVLVHEKDRSCFTNPLRSLSFIAGGHTSSMPKPHRLLREGDVIDVDGISFKVIHTPGHTPGGISLECQDALFTGDTLFFESVGRTDMPFANSDELKKSLAKLMSYGDEKKVYPGHGPQTTIGHERKNNPWILNDKTRMTK